MFLFFDYAASLSITDKNQSQIVNIMAGFLTVDGLLLGFRIRFQNTFGTGDTGPMQAKAIEAFQTAVLTLSLFWSLIAMMLAAFSTDVNVVRLWFGSAVILVYVASCSL